MDNELMPTPSMPAPAASVESPAIRAAGAGPLSLALMDSRNRTLHALSAIEQALVERTVPVHQADGEATALWLAGHIGWFAEYWIGRNTQRARGASCPSEPTRLASIEPKADRWWRPTRPWGQHVQPGEPRQDLPDGAGVRDWLREPLNQRLSCWTARPIRTNRCTFFAWPCCTKTCAQNSS